VYPYNCYDALLRGGTTSGAYTVQPPGAPAPVIVQCDQTTSGGGWNVILRRSGGAD
jgi:hypothetical protein